VTKKRIPNALTFDIEDYFSAFTARNIQVKKRFMDYQDHGTKEILKILKSANIKATFFVLGEFAKRHPDLIKRIADNGHEIGVHSYSHNNLKNVPVNLFKKDLSRAKQTVEKISGRHVVGYRAPFFSFDEKNVDKAKVLSELGFAYDSSTNPIPRALHGHPGYNPKFHKVGEGNHGFIELPLASLKLLGTNLPWAGGFYLRLMPYPVFKLGLKRINKQNGPAIVYLHNWEFDINQPRIPAKFSVRLFHYYGISATHKKLKRLVHDFDFMPVQDLCKKIGIRL